MWYTMTILLYNLTLTRFQTKIRPRKTQVDFFLDTIQATFDPHTHREASICAKDDSLVARRHEVQLIGIR